MVSGGFVGNILGVLFQEGALVARVDVFSEVVDLANDILEEGLELLQSRLKRLNDSISSETYIHVEVLVLVLDDLPKSQDVFVELVVVLGSLASHVAVLVGTECSGDSADVGDILEAVRDDLDFLVVFQGVAIEFGVSLNVNQLKNPSS